jgi:hypothetical protein
MVIYSGFIDLGNSGVLQASEGLRFAVKPLNDSGGQKAGPDDFEGDRPARLFLLRLEYGTHSAFAQQS